MYIISNYEGESTENVTFIKVGEHLGWGINTKKALKSIKTKYILHFHEDYFLCRKVSTEQFEEHVNYMEKHNLDYLRLSNNPDRDKYRIGNTKYCNDPIGLPYSLCLQPSLWLTETYKSFCIEGWTCWDFEFKINEYIKEHNISIKAQSLYSDFYESDRIPIVLETAVRKGRWTYEGAKFLLNYGFTDIYRGRHKEGFLTTFLIKINKKGVRIGPIIKYLQKLNINI